jgi:hypothetical protein
MRNIIVIATLGVFAVPGQTQDEIVAAMMTAVAFSVDRFSLRDGYRVTRVDDLSYGRSEHCEGASHVENLVRLAASATT